MRGNEQRSASGTDLDDQAEQENETYVQSAESHQAQQPPDYTVWPIAKCRQEATRRGIKMKTKAFTKVIVLGLLQENDQGYRDRNEVNPWLIQANSANKVLVRNKSTRAALLGSTAPHKLPASRRVKRRGDLEDTGEEERIIRPSVAHPIAKRSDQQGMVKFRPKASLFANVV